MGCKGRDSSCPRSQRSYNVQAGGKVTHPSATADEGRANSAQVLYMVMVDYTSNICTVFGDNMTMNIKTDICWSRSMEPSAAAWSQDIPMTSDDSAATDISKAEPLHPYICSSAPPLSAQLFASHSTYLPISLPHTCPFLQQELICHCMAVVCVIFYF